MRECGEPQSARDGGYTLIELLISLTILALLLAMVPGTLRLGKRAWETSGSPVSTAAAAALSFVEQHLKSALPVYQSDSSGLPQLVFEGSENSLSFVAELATGPAGGGLYRVDVGPRPETGNLAMRLSLFRPNPDASTTAAPGGIEIRDLGGIYSGIQFKYFGSPAPGQPAQWQSTWHRSDRLPDLVDLVATSRAISGTPNAQYRAELKMRPIL
jgi:general secretion pathway protein J